MGKVVGQDGVQAIRDFIKPYVISDTDIGNSSTIYGIGDMELSFLMYGHTSLHYTGTIDNTKLIEASKGNFGKVTEFSGQPVITLERTGSNSYIGTRSVNSNTYDRYQYIVNVNSGYCDVGVYGLCTPYDSNNNADVVFELTSLFSFTQSELLTIFSNFVGGNSFVFTKTDNDTSGIDLGVNMERVYIIVPLDTQGTSSGCMRLQYIGPDLANNLSTFALVGKGESYFFNRHQEGVFTIGNDGNNTYKSLVLINTQDVAIQCMSASDYANLSIKDSNTLYFIPEE